MEREHKYFIDYLRIAVCFMVVLIHIKANSFITSIAVPIFFMISGYLFVEKVDTYSTNKRKFVLQRVERLLIPYFAISAVMIVLSILFEKFLPHLIDTQEFQTISLSLILNKLFVEGVSGQLYFLISLFFVYIFLIPTYSWLKNKYFSLFFFLLYIVSQPYLRQVYVNIPLVGDTLILNAPDVGIKFFLFGAVIHHFEDKIKPLFEKQGFSIFLVLILVMSIIYHKGVIIFSLILIIAFLALAYFLGKNYKSTKIRFISGLTYGIYLFHLPYFVKLSELLFSPLNSHHPVLILAKALIIFFSSAIFVMLLRKNALSKKLFLGEK